MLTLLSFQYQWEWLRLLLLCSQVLEVREEAVIGSDSESVLSWTPSQPAQKSDVTASGKKCLSAIFTEVLDSPARSIIKA